MAVILLLYAWREAVRVPVKSVCPPSLSWNCSEVTAEHLGGRGDRISRLRSSKDNGRKLCQRDGVGTEAGSLVRMGLSGQVSRGGFGSVWKQVEHFPPAWSWLSWQAQVIEISKFIQSLHLLSPLKGKMLSFLKATVRPLSMGVGGRGLCP